MTKPKFNITRGLPFYLFLLLTAIIAACAKQPEPKPSDALLRETAGQTLHLTQVIIDGEIHPPFNPEQKMIVRSETDLHVSDGCNSWTYPGIVQNNGQGEPFEESPFWSYLFLQTLRGCIDDTVSQAAREFNVAMYDVRRYEIKGDEVWLYFGEEEANALVFLAEAGVE